MKGRLVGIENIDTHDVIAKWIYGNLGTSATGNFGPNTLGRLVASYRQSRPTITTDGGGTSTTRPGSTTGNWTVYHYQQNAG